ncbi:MAG: hypothetical protein COS88_01455, partial [Chloroflexi bacterium CG07_land_8_20_14_0_80_51_10]
MKVHLYGCFYCT